MEECSVSAYVHWKINKTPGYHWDILRSPILLKMPFIGMKAFFFSKYSVSSSYFLVFPILVSLLFLARKTSKIRWKNIFKKPCHLRRSLEKNLSHLAILKFLKDFCRKNLSVFPKNPNFERFENSYYSNRIRRQLCYNLV